MWPGGYWESRKEVGEGEGEGGWLSRSGRRRPATAARRGLGADSPRHRVCPCQLAAGVGVHGPARGPCGNQGAGHGKEEEADLWGGAGGLAFSLPSVTEFWWNDVGAFPILDVVLFRKETA